MRITSVPQGTPLNCFDTNDYFIFTIQEEILNNFPLLTCYIYNEWAC